MGNGAAFKSPFAYPVNFTYVKIGGRVSDNLSEDTSDRKTTTTTTTTTNSVDTWFSTCKVGMERMNASSVVQSLSSHKTAVFCCSLVVPTVHTQKKLDRIGLFYFYYYFLALRYEKDVFFYYFYLAVTEFWWRCGPVHFFFFFFVFK